jgi:hypothetical protein
MNKAIQYSSENIINAGAHTGANLATMLPTCRTSSDSLINEG